MKYLILITIVICIIRFFIEPSHISFNGTYQAIAHLFVGGLFGAYFSLWDKKYLYLGLGMSLIEIIAAIISRI